MLLILHNRRNKKALINARAIVLSTHGDLTFGSPAPMRQNTFEMIGGEIDPVTGQMKLFGDMDNGGTVTSRTDAWHAAALPQMFGGVKGNPLFGNEGQASSHQSDEYTDERPDLTFMLDNLDDFEEEDFESFADSLLNDDDDNEGVARFESELFSARTPAQLDQGQNTDASAWQNLSNKLGSIEDDNLSDFEDSEDDDVDLNDVDSVVGDNNADGMINRVSMVVNDLPPYVNNRREAPPSHKARVNKLERVSGLGSPGKNRSGVLSMVVNDILDDDLSSLGESDDEEVYGESVVGKPYFDDVASATRKVQNSSFML